MTTTWPRLLIAVLSMTGCATVSARKASAVTAEVLANLASQNAHTQGRDVAPRPPVEASHSLCYPDCAAGSRCNEATGVCEPVPCHRACRPDQVCRVEGFIESCVTLTGGDLPSLPPAELITPQ